MIEDGIVPELLLGRKYGHQLHFWDLTAGKHLQTVDLGSQYQMVLELRPSHDPGQTWGFAGVVISTEDLSASVWRWNRSDDGTWRADKVITIPAEPASPDDLPPALKPFGAVPPLVSDINLSVDDKYLYVSCWGTGELKQYDVSDPLHPREAGSVRLGGITRPGRAPRRTGRAAGRRPADGRGQPGRQADLPDELAVRLVGRPVLPGRRGRLKHPRQFRRIRPWPPRRHQQRGNEIEKSAQHDRAVVALDARHDFLSV
jgi:hypothetical protein